MSEEKEEKEPPSAEAAESEEPRKVSKQQVSNQNEDSVDSSSDFLQDKASGGVRYTPKINRDNESSKEEDSAPHLPKEKSVKVVDGKGNQLLSFKAEHKKYGDVRFYDDPKDSVDNQESSSNRVDLQ